MAMKEDYSVTLEKAMWCPSGCSALCHVTVHDGADPALRHVVRCLTRL